MKTYRCIKEFYLSNFNEDGFETGEECYIDKLSLWNEDESGFKVISGEIRLENDNKWIEISKERLKCFFEEIN